MALSPAYPTNPQHMLLIYWCYTHDYSHQAQRKREKPGNRLANLQVRKQIMFVF